MSAKLRKPRKSASSSSNLEKILRKPLKSSKEPFDLIALGVEGAVVGPGIDAVALGWNHWNHAHVEHQLPCLIALMGLIHQHRQTFRRSGQLPQQFAVLRCVVRVARR